MPNLKKKASSAITWDLAGMLIQRGFGFVISIILARLLLPEEFGVVGMAMVFIAITQVFIDVGLSSSLIQSKDATPLTYSSVFYLNVALGVAAFLLFFLLAPFIGNFYDNPEITSLLRWLSVSLLFNSFNLVQSAVLQKNLNFKKLTLRRTIAAAAGGTAGIIAAIYNFGAYSLVIQTLVAGLFGTVLLWSVAGWKPDFKFSMAEVKKVSGFSTYVFLDHAVSRVFQRIDILILGKLFSPAILGYYSRAETMRDQVGHYSAASIKKAFFPILSSLQENDERFKDVYFKLLSVICFISFGITGVLFFLGHEIITILYGNRWAPCAEMFQILILAGVNRPINSISIVSLLSKGKAKENFFMGLYRKTFAIAPFLFLFISMEAYRWAMVFFWYYLTVSIFFFADRHIGIDKYRSLLIVLRYGVVFFAGIPLFYLLEKFFPQSLFAWLFTFGFVAAYFGVHKMSGSVGFVMFLDVARDRLQSLFKKIKKTVR